MKRFILVLLLFLPLCLAAQDYEKRGDSAYNSGDYNEAMIQYKAAMALLEAKNIDVNSAEYLLVQRKYARAEKCLPLKTNADRLFEAAERRQTEEAYSAAKTAYQNIIKENAKDSYAKSKIRECDREIISIASRAADESLWAKVQSTPTLESYKAYLAEFPRGRHAKEANNQILRLEDNLLWTDAKRSGTRAAYENYLAQTKTADHSSQAQFELGKIRDNELWAPLRDGQDENGLQAYINDTTNVYKQYLAQANAYLTIIKTKRYAATANSDARQIVSDLTSAQNSVTLDEESLRILEEKKAIVSYEDFMKNPTVTAGKNYLQRYSGLSDMYRDNVSEKLARLYAENFTLNSTSKDYAEAMQYAKTPATRQYVKEKYDVIAKKRKVNRRRAAWDERWQIGIGMDMEFINNFAWGPRVEMKIGSAEDVFNFSVGAKYLMWNPGEIDPEDLGKDDYRAKIGANQVPVYATLKFNLADIGSSSDVCKIYLAAEGAYNFNFSSKFKAPDLSRYFYSSSEGDEYYPGLWEGEIVPDENLIIKNNITAGLRLGLNWRIVDFGIYGKYDVTPMFDSAYIATVPDYAYERIAGKVNGRFRLGFDLIIYIIL